MDAARPYAGPFAPRVAAADAAALQPERPSPPPAPRPDIGTGTHAGAGRRAPDAAAAASEQAEGPDGLTAEQRELLQRLAARDREVRDHENAHATVGGPYAGRPTYEFEVGPDGRRYAIGGETPIDAAPIEGDPEATILKMTVVESAALAPPKPSATDRAIAALARARAIEAEIELAASRRAAAGAPEDGVSVRV